MGLDRDFLSMLSARVRLEKKMGSDQFGNDTYALGVEHAAYVESASSRFGNDEEARKTKDPNITASVITDAIGVAPGDRFLIGGSYHWVSEVETMKDEFGNDLYQTSQVTTTKRG